MVISAGTARTYGKGDCTVSWSEFMRLVKVAQTIVGAAAIEFDKKDLKKYMNLKQDHFALWKRTSLVNTFSRFSKNW